MMKNSDEKRKFSRVHFSSKAELIQKQHRTFVDVIDISLKGVMLDLFNTSAYDIKSPLQLQVTLTENTHILMGLRYVHHEQNAIGFECVDIDADSMTHLRRLVELNLGDSHTAERELFELFKQTS